jgi:hypothetical protein
MFESKTKSDKAETIMGVWQMVASSFIVIVASLGLRRL